MRFSLLLVSLILFSLSSQVHATSTSPVFYKSKHALQSQVEDTVFASSHYAQFFHSKPIGQLYNEEDVSRQKLYPNYFLLQTTRTVYSKGCVKVTVKRK